MKLRTPLIIIGLACGLAFGTGVTPGCGSSGNTGGGGSNAGGQGQGGTPGTGGTTTTPGTGGTTTTSPSTGGSTSSTSPTGSGGAGGGAGACMGSGPNGCNTCADVLLSGGDPAQACPGTADKIAAVEACVCNPQGGCAMDGGACHDSCANMTMPSQACVTCGETQCAADPSVAACVNDTGMGSGTNPCP